MVIDRVHAQCVGSIIITSSSCCPPITSCPCTVTAIHIIRCLCIGPTVICTRTRAVTVGAAIPHAAVIMAAVTRSVGHIVTNIVNTLTIVTPGAKAAVLIATATSFWSASICATRFRRFISSKSS